MKSKSIKIIIFSTALATLFLAILAIRNSNSPTPPASNGDVEQDVQIENGIPDLTLKDYNGNNINLRNIEGKLILLNSWATWCPFCINEIDDFIQAQEELSGQLTVVLINREESLAQAKKFTDDIGATGKVTTLLDPDDLFYRSIGGFAMPETLLVRDGEVILHKRGPMTLQEVKTNVQSALESI